MQQDSNNECAFPTIKGINAWDKGCRCSRCVEAKREANRASYAKHRDARKARQRAYNARNAQSRRESAKEYRAKNQQKVRDAAAAYRLANGDTIAAFQARYRHANRGLLKAKAAMHRARRLGAIPDGTDLELVTAIYIYCPPGYEVDHIVPLSRRAGGKHAPENLQYLTASANRRKGDSADFAYRDGERLRWQDHLAFADSIGAEASP